MITCQLRRRSPRSEEVELPSWFRYIKQLELGRDALPLYKLLRRNSLKLSVELRLRVRTWLADKPALRELWAIKEPSIACT